LLLDRFKRIGKLPALLRDGFKRLFSANYLMKLIKT
jgi:hypothetical protein